MNMQTRLKSLNTLIGFVMLLVLPLAVASESNFPATMDLGAGNGQLTLYLPQVDEMADEAIRFRSALAWREGPGAEPVFGVGWFRSKVDIDRSKGTVHPYNLELIDSRFPEGTPDLDAPISAALDAGGNSRRFDFTLSQLESSLEMAQAEAKSVEKLNTSPPEIIYRDRPALLVTLDGEPVLRDIEQSSYKAVINTPYPLISDGRYYYLNAAKDVWYRAGEATGPYRFLAAPPAEITALVKPDENSAAAEEPAEKITAANAPEIVVTTKPAELIVTEGPAAFVPLVDDLLVLQNSDSDVFMDVNSQDFFIVLAGRWYRAESLNGPWKFERSDQLPPAFANIPEHSEQADSRVYVSGTPEARDAVMDAQVPQTAAVERGEVDVDVDYDGQPQFAPVDGTQDMVYATNTGSTVVYTNRIYYLVEDGVWYESASPHGPWEVSVQRPAQVVYIDPTSPVYNVKYVRIYDYTPRVVYVGYTPGYVGSYVYHDTLFYGSGWYYRPWVTAHYYYPRPRTWGFHVGYNSWYGWSFGLSWGWGPFSFGWYSGGYWHHHHHWHHRHHGYWGPRGYRPRPVPYHRGRGHDRYVHGDRHYRDGRGRHRGQRHDNLYADQRQPARVIDTRDNRPRRSPGVRDGQLYASNDRGLKPDRVRGGNFKPAAVNKSELQQKAVSRDRKLAQAPARGYKPDKRVARGGESRKQPVSKSTPVANKSASKPGRVKSSGTAGIPLPRNLARSSKPISKSQLRNTRVAQAPQRNNRSEV